METYGNPGVGFPGKLPKQLNPHLAFCFWPVIKHFSNWTTFEVEGNVIVLRFLIFLDLDKDKNDLSCEGEDLKTQ